MTDDLEIVESNIQTQKHTFKDSVDTFVTCLMFYMALIMMFFFQCHVNFSFAFSEGSVKVSYTAEIEDSAMSPVTEMGVLQGITKALDIGEFGNFTVDPASVKAEGTLNFLPFLMEFVSSYSVNRIQDCCFIVLHTKLENILICSFTETDLEE